MDSIFSAIDTLNKEIEESETRIVEINGAKLFQIQSEDGNRTVLIYRVKKLSRSDQELSQVQ